MKDITPPPPTRCVCEHKRSDHPGGKTCRWCNKKCRAFTPEVTTPVRRPA